MNKMQNTIFSAYREPNPEQLATHSQHNLAWMGVGPNALLGLSIIQSIPVFIMFIIFREQLMKGIKLRGFK